MIKSKSQIAGSGLAAINLLTITKYRGIDPETGATSTPSIDAGRDYDNSFPKSWEISLGATVSF